MSRKGKERKNEGVRKKETEEASGGNARTFAADLGHISPLIITALFLYTSIEHN